jgi:lysyl-tRNA synthetase class II
VPSTQLKDSQSDDYEAIAIDEVFCAALEYDIAADRGLGFGHRSPCHVADRL